MGFEIPLMRPAPEEAVQGGDQMGSVDEANQDQDEEQGSEEGRDSNGEGSDVEEADVKRRKVDDANADDAEKLNEYAKYVSLRKARGSLYPPLQKRAIAVARPIAEMKGHTAFLTFAVCPNYPNGVPTKAAKPDTGGKSQGSKSEP
jgi:hypothetical protein